MDASDIGDRDTLGKLLRTNKRLARELSRIDTVFNAIQSAIVVTDKLGTIQFANNYAMRVLGLGNSAQSIFKVLPGIDGAFAEMEDSDALMRREFEIFYPEYRLLSAQIIPFDFGGGRKYFCGYFKRHYSGKALDGGKNRERKTCIGDKSGFGNSA